MFTEDPVDVYCRTGAGIGAAARVCNGNGAYRRVEKRPGKRGKGIRYTYDQEPLSWLSTFINDGLEQCVPLFDTLERN